MHTNVKYTIKILNKLIINKFLENNRMIFIDTHHNHNSRIALQLSYHHATLDLPH